MLILDDAYACERSHPMDIPFATVTLLGAAVDTDGYAWLAADAKEIRSDRYSGNAYDEHTNEKLYSRGKSLAWGYYGDTQYGAQFEYAFSNTTLPTEWKQLASVCANGLRRINQGRSLVGALFVGFVGGKLKILGITATGSTDWDDSCIFVGNGRVAAKSVWYATARSRPDLSIRDRLVLSMGATIQSEAWLSFPISLWRMSPAGNPIDRKLIFEDDLPSVPYGD